MGCRGLRYAHLNEATTTKSLVLALDDALKCVSNMQVERERASSSSEGLSRSVRGRNNTVICLSDKTKPSGECLITKGSGL